MNIDKYIQHWARQILKESGEENGTQSELEERCALAVARGGIVTLCQAICRTEGEPINDYFNLEVEFGGMPMIEIKNGTYYPTKQCLEIFSEFTDSDPWNLNNIFVDKGIYTKFKQSIAGQIKYNVCIKNGGRFVVKPGVYELEARGISFGRVKGSTLKMTMEIVKDFGAGFDFLASKHRKRLKDFQDEPKTLLPRESEEV